MGASHFSFDDRTLNRVLVQSDRDEETQTPRLPPQTMIRRMKSCAISRAEEVRSFGYFGG